MWDLVHGDEVITRIKRLLFSFIWLVEEIIGFEVTANMVAFSAQVPRRRYTEKLTRI